MDGVPRLAPGIIESLRLKYVTAQPPIGIRDLAAKAKIGSTTLMRYSRSGDWPGQRAAYWAQEVARATVEAEAVVAGATTKAVGDQKDMVESLRWWITTLDDLAGVLAKDIDKRIEEIEPADRAKLLSQLAAARSTIQKSLELIEGRPTERVAVSSDPVPVSQEFSEEFAEALRVARDRYGRN